jgi:hypothetical protein
MTTIKDLLKDFQNDTIELVLERAGSELSPDEIEENEIKLEDLIDDFINTIKERIVG